MKTNRIKSVTFMSGASIDIYNGSADVFITLEDDSRYWVEVGIPQDLTSHMDEKNGSGGGGRLI